MLALMSGFIKLRVTATKEKTSTKPRQAFPSVKEGVQERRGYGAPWICSAQRGHSLNLAEKSTQLRSLQKEKKIKKPFGNVNK